MEVSIEAQLAAFGGAFLIGAAAGVLYDLFRVLRVRIRIPLIGIVLDALFWILVTAALFLWSVRATGGEVRIYVVAAIFLGGVLYFWKVSSWVLKLGYQLADFCVLLFHVALFPLTLGAEWLKNFRKFAKNIFHYRRKWYKIKQITKEAETARRRKTAREEGGRFREGQKGGIADQDRGAGAADLHSHHTVGHAGKAAGRAERSGPAEPTGGRTETGKR